MAARAPHRAAVPLLLLAVHAALACAEPGAEERGGPSAGGREGGADADTAAVSPETAPDPGSGAASVDPAVVCDTIRNSFRCARAIEALQLPRADRAERRGDALLLLALSGGDTARLEDRTGPPSSVRRYSFQEHWPEAGYFVVHEQHYEGSEHLVVDDSTGERTRVPDRPLLAPGGARFAVLSLDLEAGYAPNTIQIWRLTPEGPRREWERSPEDWGAGDGRWTDAETLTFTRECPFGAEDSPGCGSRMTLHRTGGTWTLEGG